MSEHLNVDEIIDHNPQVDPEQFAEARELLRKLRERGVRRKGYELAPPYRGRRASVRDESGDDPRLIRLRRSR